MSSLTVLALTGLAAYMAACLFWPLVKCSRCKGTGMLPQPWSSIHARVCTACGGKKWFTRWGARALRALFGHRDR